MNAWTNLGMAVVAAGSVAAFAWLEFRRRPSAMAVAVPPLATALGGAFPAAALALAFALARVHPGLALLPPLAAAAWIGPDALGIAAAWVVAAGPWWAGTLGVLVTAAINPWVGLIAGAAGLAGHALDRHPARQLAAFNLRRRALWALPVPALALFALATLGRAAGTERAVFGRIAETVVGGPLLVAALVGIGLRLETTDGRAGAWTGALAGAVGLLAYRVGTGTLGEGVPVVACLVVVASCAAAPVAARFPWPWTRRTPHGSRSSPTPR